MLDEFICEYESLLELADEWETMDEIRRAPTQAELHAVGTRLLPLIMKGEWGGVSYDNLRAMLIEVAPDLRV